jgi:hypothetical protein
VQERGGEGGLRLVTRADIVPPLTLSRGVCGPREVLRMCERSREAIEMIVRNRINRVIARMHSQSLQRGGGGGITPNHPHSSVHFLCQTIFAYI